MYPSLPKALLKVLATPQKIAKTLNSGAASVLSLNIHRDKICVAVGSHDDISKLPSIPMANLRKGDDCTQSLSQIIDEHNVCGFVVAWPLQRDTGKVGGDCGRVLFTLDKLLGQADSLITAERPLVLWDSFRSNNTRKYVDDWGRCISYGQPSGKTLHLASKEQYHQNEQITAAGLFEDFCKIHLPQVSKRTARRKQQREKRGSLSQNLVSDFKSQRAYSKASPEQNFELIVH
jgi:RNase H-fold protein (predicted Holliday junction resolvase)